MQSNARQCQEIRRQGDDGDHGTGRPAARPRRRGGDGAATATMEPPDQQPCPVPLDQEARTPECKH
eukprot:1921302-Pyramimonas_sp.AAC.1